MTGFTIDEFDRLVVRLGPAWERELRRRSERPDRKRAPGAGRRARLPFAQAVFVALVRYRSYPTWRVMDALLGVAWSTLRDAMLRVEPVLARVLGPRPPGGRVPTTLAGMHDQIPDLASVLVDATEQPILRPSGDRRQRASYSGKAKRHTRKTQLITTGGPWPQILSIDTCRGSVHDKALLDHSQRLTRLSAGTRVVMDSGYMGTAAAHPTLDVQTSRRKPRGAERPPEDRRYNRDLARTRIGAEHAIRRCKMFRAAKDIFRDKRARHNRTWRIVAGLANQQVAFRRPVLAVAA